MHQGSFTITPGAHMNEIGAGSFQHLGDLLGLLRSRAFLHSVFCPINPNANREVRPDPLPDRLQNLNGKPRPVFKGLASVFIQAPVFDTGKKAINQIAMSGMYLHAIEPRFLNTLGPFGKLFDNDFNLRNS